MNKHKYTKITVEKADGSTLVFDLNDPNCEPVFLLRGQDRYAPQTVEIYSILVKEGQGLFPHLWGQAEHAQKHAEAMRNWPMKKYPD